jgi:hypothetical protein
VRTVALANPEDLPERHYQVGWTAPTAIDTEHKE